jgi:hypothetical protein
MEDTRTPRPTWGYNAQARDAARGLMHKEPNQDRAPQTTWGPLVFGAGNVLLDSTLPGATRVPVGVRVLLGAG